MKRILRRLFSSGYRDQERARLARHGRLLVVQLGLQLDDVFILPGDLVTDDYGIVVGIYEGGPQFLRSGDHLFMDQVKP